MKREQQAITYIICDICGKREEDEDLYGEFQVKNISPNGKGATKTFHACYSCAGGHNYELKRLFKFIVKLFPNKPA